MVVEGRRSVVALMKDDGSFNPSEGLEAILVLCGNCGFARLHVTDILLHDGD